MFENTLQFYGVDWLAMLLTFIAIWKIGNKEKSGFVLMIVGNVCWMVLGVQTSSLAMFLANLIFMLLNLRAIIKWNEEKV